jgi:hypothetical protein
MLTAVSEVLLDFAQGDVQRYERVMAIAERCTRTPVTAYFIRLKGCVGSLLLLIARILGLICSGIHRGMGIHISQVKSVDTHLGTGHIPRSVSPLI